jgi:hypothetical protein
MNIKKFVFKTGTFREQIRGFMELATILLVLIFLSSFDSAAVKDASVWMARKIVESSEPSNQPVEQVEEVQQVSVQTVQPIPLDHHIILKRLGANPEKDAILKKIGVNGEDFDRALKSR